MWRESVWSDLSEAHVARHDVTPVDVEDVVNTRPWWEHPGVDDSTLVYGRTADGRYLMVVLAESMDGRWYVVTARGMATSGMRTYRREGH